MEPDRSVEWGGFTWYRQPDSPRRNDRVYYKSCVGGRPRYLHRAIWEASNGAIPRGWHVHHRNGDPFDNRLENLEARDGREHLREHGSERWEANPESILRGLEKARALAPEWHRSKEGREWHSVNAKRVVAARRSSMCKCKECGSDFVGFDGAFFCGIKCTNRWHARERRRSGVDNVERTCGKCGKPFTVNKYSKQQNCCRLRADGR